MLKMLISKKESFLWKHCKKGEHRKDAAAIGLNTWYLNQKKKRVMNGRNEEGILAQGSGLEWLIVRLPKDR